MILLAHAVFWLLCRTRDRLTLAGRYTLQLPQANLVLQQLLISALDILASAAVLWLLLPSGSVDFAVLATWYAIAIMLGILSHLPGGLGVFEAVMLFALGDHVPTGTLAAALLLYRAIYYFLPLALALVALAGYELRSGVAAPLARAAANLSPLLLAGFTLVMGVVLLLSGVTPNADEASRLLARHVPLPLVEASHFLGSLSGLALLVVARGMLRRLDAAWWAGLCIALLGAVLVIIKGLALIEAAALVLLALALLASRRQFHRKASLFAHPLSPGWLVAMGAIVAFMIGVLFFVYRDVDYAHELWWRLEFDSDAPRSLRASLAVAICTLVLALRHLFKPARQPLALPDDDTLDRVAGIVATQPAASACLALMGDKKLLFSRSGSSFLMFGQHGRSWIALTDPIGLPAEQPELIWRFLELAREQGGRPAFYQIRPQALTHYLDAGLRAYKLGEEAHVPLADFSLKGSARANLRHGVNRAERDGLSFELVRAEHLPALLPELRRISDAWLAAHNTAEKRFSLGAFVDDYVLRQSVAVVRHGEHLVAFASLMCTAQKTEASIDLMRHLPTAPGSTMDFLFVRLIQHFQAEGFARFNLGMAPLSGMAAHPLAPAWHRVGRLLFTNGEQFYNFQGLRAFKEKFDPVWEARYLAVAGGGLAPLMVLADTAVLISGGLKGVFAK